MSIDCVIIDVMPTTFDIIFILDSIPRLPAVVAGAVLSVFLVLMVYLNYTKKQKQTSVLETNQQKGYGILQSAIKKAEAIIAQAELTGIKVSAQSKLQTKDLEEMYLLSVKETMRQSEQAVRQSQEEVKAYVLRLGSQAEKSTSQNGEMLKQQVNKVFETFEENLSAFLTQTQQQSTQAIQLEMQAARGLIETYKQQQFHLVDENVVAMLERTLSLVLIKKLSFKEHVDLVYEALEKAKEEKFFV